MELTLMTQAELARHFRVSRQAVHTWTRREGFPRGVNDSKVYRVADVQAWLETTRSPALEQAVPELTRATA